MPYLTTRAEPELKAAFCKQATARGLSESQLLRQLVFAELGKPESAAPIKPKPISGPVEYDRLTVRMPRFLMQAVAARAEMKGMARSRWISALVQSHLMEQPVMTDAELVALKASNRELAALGRNINQIAKAINQAFYETERVRLDTLAKLSKAIASNRAAIRALVRASQNSWGSD